MSVCLPTPRARVAERPLPSCFAPLPTTHGAPDRGRGGVGIRRPAPREGRTVACGGWGREHLVAKGAGAYFGGAAAVVYVVLFQYAPKGSTQEHEVDLALCKVKAAHDEGSLIHYLHGFDGALGVESTALD
jgi:hypothetical protein